MTRTRLLAICSRVALPATLSLVVLGGCGGSNSTSSTGGQSGSNASGGVTGGAGDTGSAGSASPGTAGSAGGTAGTSDTGSGGSASAGTTGSAGTGGSAGRNEGHGGAAAGSTGSGRGGTGGSAAGTAGSGGGGRGGSAAGTTGTGGAVTGTGGSGTGGAGTATTWIHPTDPFPGVTTGDLGTLLVMPNGDIYLSRLAGLAKSTDHGDSWTTISGSLPSPIVPSLGLNSLGEIVAGVGKDAQGTGANFGAYRLSGGVWTRATGITATNSIGAFTLDQTGALLAVTGFDGDVWRSTDNGTSYTKVASHVGSTTGVSVGALITIGKMPNGDLYTGGEIPAVYRSQDNGATWAAFGLATPTYKDNLLVITFNRLGEPLIARDDTGGNGLQRYTNGAWTPASSGVTPYSYVRSVVLNSRSGKLYLANNNNSGNGYVFTSADDGQTWQSFSNGLPNTGMNYLAFAPDGTLYLVTRDGRFYRTAGPVP